MRLAVSLGQKYCPESAKRSIPLNSSIPPAKVHTIAAAKSRERFGSKNIPFSTFCVLLLRYHRRCPNHNVVEANRTVHGAEAYLAHDEFIIL